MAMAPFKVTQGHQFSTNE